MPFRLVAYAVRIWESWLKEHAGAVRIPAVVPVVLHHGEDGWTTARALEDLYDLDPEALAAAGDAVLRLRFTLDDIGREDDEDLRARAMSALGRLVLYCFRHARNPAELIAGLSRCWDLVSEVYAAPNGLAALRTVWRYILLIHDAPPDVILEQLAVVTPDPIKEKLMTAGEVLIERGRIQGERRLLLRGLTVRFGPVPGELVAQVNAADEAQLDAWLDRSYAASSLAEVFASS
jgi:hypothetical protein